MRTIKRIVLHCTATSQNTTVQSILNYWRNVKMWRSPGYHFLIEPDGKVNELLPIEYPSNGARGFNHDSIHISYIGGVDENNIPVDNRTGAQKVAMIDTINLVREQFPGLPVVGHRDLPNVRKACPSFDVAPWMKTIGI